MAADQAKQAAKQFLAKFLEANSECSFRDARHAAGEAGHKLSPVMWRWARVAHEPRIAPSRQRLQEITVRLWSSAGEEVLLQSLPPIDLKMVRARCEHGVFELSVPIEP